jgi:RND superfamily putative drug exporter
MAAMMNMLSAGAAFGVITAVFQFGWAPRCSGSTQTGPIEAFIPVMMFAILFGLSMDYEVFLVTRIYEEWHKTHDNRSRSPAGSRRPAARSPPPPRSWCSCSARSSSAAR